jgi:hypothetical protein
VTSQHVRNIGSRPPNRVQAASGSAAAGAGVPWRRPDRRVLSSGEPVLEQVLVPFNIGEHLQFRELPAGQAPTPARPAAKVDGETGQQYKPGKKS